MTPFVTKHALRRYAERVMKIAIDEALTDDAAVETLVASGVDCVGIAETLRAHCQRAVELGATGVRTDKARIVLKGRIVVSVLPKRRLQEINQHHIGRQ